MFLLVILVLSLGTLTTSSAFLLVLVEENLALAFVISLLPLLGNVLILSLGYRLLIQQEYIIWQFLTSHSIVSAWLMAILIWIFLPWQLETFFLSIFVIFSGSSFGLLIYKLRQQVFSSSLVSNLVDEVSLRSSREQIVLKSIANGIILLNNHGEIIFANKAMNNLFNDFQKKYIKSRLQDNFTLIDLNNKKEIDLIQNLCENDHYICWRALIGPKISSEDSSIPSINSSAMSTSSVEISQKSTDSLEKITQNKQKIITLTAALIKNTDNTPHGYVVTVVDITKEYQLEKMRLDFISIASHELRTPLTSLNGYLTLLMKPEIPDDKKTFAINHAKSSATRLTKLVSNILKVSTLEQNQVKVHKEDFDLLAVVQEEIENLHFQSQEKDIAINLLNETGLTNIEVYSDPAIIREVFINLLDNAIKYSPKHQSINVDITLVNHEKGTKVEVADRGVGIKESDQKNLFEQFSRGENILTESTQGAGLGLYICKKMLSLLDGEISFFSSTHEVSHGSTFWFIIPLKKDTPFSVQQQNDQDQK